MIAAEWQILFHSFQGKDIDIQILDGYTEQMPLLARGMRATAGMPRLWGKGKKNKTKSTHAALAEDPQQVSATGLSHILFPHGEQRRAVCSFAPALFLKVPLLYLDPTGNCTGCVDYKNKSPEAWVLSPRDIFPSWITHLSRPQAKRTGQDLRWLLTNRRSSWKLLLMKGRKEKKKKKNRKSSSPSKGKEKKQNTMRQRLTETEQKRQIELFILKKRGQIF